MAEAKEKKIDIRKKVTVVATEKHPSYKKGEEFQCGEVLVPHLVAKGVIVDPNPKAKEVKKDETK